MNKKILKLFKIALLGPLFPILSIPQGEGSQEGQEGQEGQENNNNNNNTGEENPANENQDNEGTQGDNKTFSQQDLDKIISQRLKKQEKKLLADFEEEKKKANMTEIEKANLERDNAIKEIENLKYQNNQNLIKNEVFQIAAQMNAVDFEAVYQLLNKENISIENGKTTGVKEAVTNLLNEKKYLVKGIEQRVGHEQNNNNIPDSNKKFNDLIRGALGR